MSAFIFSKKGDQGTTSLLNGERISKASSRPEAYGTLDEQGRYRLSTYAQADGAVPGDYRVVVESREELTPDAEMTKQMVNGRVQSKGKTRRSADAEPAVQVKTARTLQKQVNF